MERFGSAQDSRQKATSISFVYLRARENHGSGRGLYARDRGWGDPKRSIFAAMAAAHRFSPPTKTWMTLPTHLLVGQITLSLPRLASLLLVPLPLPLLRTTVLLSGSTWGQPSPAWLSGRTTALLRSPSGTYHSLLLLLLRSFVC